MNKPLVASDFVVPEKFETSDFRLRMLTVSDVVKDYDAVMTSVDHLQGVFGGTSKWPSAQLSLEQDLIDLGWHQKEFQRRSSFAYTMMTLDESRCLGCMYIYPPDETQTNIDAQIIFWVRASEAHTDLEKRLFESIKSWMKSHWPFTKIAYPGRDTTTGLRLKQ